MNKKKMTMLAMSAAIIVCISILGSFYLSTLRNEPAQIVLPPYLGDAVNAPDFSTASHAGDDIPERLDLTKNNVRAAVGALSRPSEYSAEVAVSLSFAEGSSESKRRVWVHSGFQHTYGVSGLGSGRHIISGNGKSYRWDDGDTHFYVGESGEITPDDELWIPTYEDISQISPRNISTVGYTSRDGYDCIFLSARDGTGRTMRYWVSIDLGLLVAGELCDEKGNVIYSSSLSFFDPVSPGSLDFMLPGGSTVFE